MFFESSTASVKDVEIPAAGNIADVWNPEIYAYHTPWITKTPELYQEATRNLIQRAGEGRSAAYAQARHQVDIADGTSRGYSWTWTS